MMARRHKIEMGRGPFFGFPGNSPKKKEQYGVLLELDNDVVGQLGSKTYRTSFNPGM